MTQIALFGTSADPPTVGHQSILRWLSERYDKVTVWAADNPFKDHGASLEQRNAMLQMLIDDLACDNVSLDGRLGDRHSLNTVKIAKEIWGEDAEYLLVIGADLASQIHRWYRAKDLLQQVTLLIFPRKGYPIQPEALKKLSSLKSHWQEADYTPPPVSSTQYRIEGRAAVVIEAIAHYIAAEKLYAVIEPKT
ncbi:nicotinate (nicotinamide) nucleotide adenylyltransferase [[Leptolyngbya] sp. PCC 7376]|uniref:nicotinate-nucleotide adenylyltransferase n=1 Tax=[Leptolyngbya] sp. PCC 7376 TaxID=111781 RepID=UPI00029F4217|nr:nicotinate-nucleotide adenylyltransferase [[Leptolyngbya] sp. PCC 7376]AFY40299.1 nicotinate (nicotinamide) nucleotide adenylyltransferase [[Leptolyngbya] sp. PCC 7376]